MFQDQPEKGLFTFYWEQTHKECSDPATHRSQVVEPTLLRSGREGMGIEEKERHVRHHQTEKQEPYLGRHHSHLYFNFDKESKNVLVPHTVTLAPGISDSKPRIGRD